MERPRTVEPLERSFAAAYDRLSPVAERGTLGERRERLLRDVTGDVVDVGAGVGANLDHLGDGVTSVTLLEPSAPMAQRLRRHVADRSSAFPVDILEAPGEAMPLPDDSADVVACTLVLCTVDDVELTLREVQRILRPGGRLVILEHVRGDGATARIQDMIRPVWSFFGGGCDPTRDTRRSLERTGFDTSAITSFSLSGAGPVSPAIEGIAWPR